MNKRQRKNPANSSGHIHYQLSNPLHWFTRIAFVAFLAIPTLLLSAVRLNAQEIVDARSGKLLLQHTDLVLQAGPVNLGIQRTLQTKQGKPGLLGPRWRLNWESRLYRSGPIVEIEEAAGVSSFRQAETKPEYTTRSGERVIFDKKGHALRTRRDGTTETFDPNGRLIRLDYRNGNIVMLRYNGRGKLSHIEGPKGSFLKLMTEKSGRVHRIETSTGLNVQYTYVQDDLTEVRINGERVLRYTYNGTGQLTRVDYEQSGPVEIAYDRIGRVVSLGWADGSQERHEYDDSANSYRRIGPAGGITTVHWSRDGRTEERTDPLGNKTIIEYDAFRRRMSVTDPTGSTTRYTHDSLGRAVDMVDSSGQRTQFEYLDETSKIRKIIRPDGTGEVFSYDGQRNLTSIEIGGETLLALTYYPDGLVATTKGAGSEEYSFTYHPDGLLKSVTNAFGEKRQFEYDDRGNVIREIPPFGGTIVRSYDHLDRIVSLKDSTGETLRYSYNALGHLSRVTSQAEGVTRYTYDARGRIRGVTNPYGGTTRYTYDGNNRLLSITDAAGHRVQFEYDKRGYLVREINPLGGIREWTYDVLGRVASHKDSAGGTFVYEYDGQDRLAEIVFPNGQSEGYSYNADGNLVQMKQASGAVWTFQYDQAGRIVSVLGPLGLSQTIRYDGKGRLIETRDALGRKAEYAYDGSGRIVRSKDAARQSTRFEYDSQGRHMTVIDPLGRRVIFKRDRNGLFAGMDRGDEQVLKLEYSQGRLSNMHGPALSSVSVAYDGAGQTSDFHFGNGEKVHFRYDILGRIVEATDGVGHTWIISYTALGDLESITAPDGTRYRYDYTSSGQLESITDARGYERRFAYDSMGRRVRETDPLGRTTEFTYGWGTQIVTVKRGDGQRTAMVYDMLGRLTEVRYPSGPPARFWYDQAGNLIREERGEYRAEYRYDVLDRIVEAKYHPANRTVRYHYDKGGRRTALEVEGVGKWDYQYDARDRLVALRDPDGRLTRFEYDDAGRVTRKTLPSGVTLERSYDARGRILSLSAHNSMGQTLVNRRYEYNGAGNLTEEIREKGAEFTYRYDEKDQLIERHGPQGLDRIAYDAVGNRLLPEYPAEFDRADQLTRFGEETFAYDDVGRMIIHQGHNGKWEYVYGPAGRLTSVKRNGAHVGEYGYDTWGRRIWKVVEGKKTYYLYDGLRLLLELDDTRNVSRVWTQGHELDRPIGFAKGNRAYYPIADAFNSAVALTDHDGTVINRWDYGPYGELHRAAAEKRSGEEYPYRFAGGQFDPETGLYYFRARYYEPRLGRFLTPDPLRGQLTNPISLHPYQYALNNPLRYHDPTGATAEDIANGLTHYAGSYAGRAGHWVGSYFGPNFAWYTGAVSDTIAGSVASIVTEPLRVGSGLGTASVEAEQSWSALREGRYWSAAGHGLSATLHTASDILRAVPFYKAAKHYWKAAKTLANPSEVITAQTNAQKILSEKRIWGETEGSVYAGISERTSGPLAWLRNTRTPRPGDVEFVFRGEAAKLFKPHEVWGPFSLVKRLGGQFKAGPGDIKLTEFVRESGRVIVTKAELLKGQWAGQSGRWAQLFGNTAAERAFSRLWMRRIAELGGNAVLPVSAYATYVLAEPHVEALNETGKKTGDLSALNAAINVLTKTAQTKEDPKGTGTRVSAAPTTSPPISPQPRPPDAGGAEKKAEEGPKTEGGDDGSSVGGDKPYGGPIKGSGTDTGQGGDKGGDKGDDGDGKPGTSGGTTGDDQEPGTTTATGPGPGDGKDGGTSAGSGTGGDSGDGDQTVSEQPAGPPPSGETIAGRFIGRETRRSQVDGDRRDRQAYSGYGRRGTKDDGLQVGRLIDEMTRKEDEPGKPPPAGGKPGGGRREASKPPSQGKNLTNITVNKRTITVTFWDHGQEDGDTIDIMLNGKVIRGGIVLTNAPQSITLDLKGTKNNFGVKAVNEGSIPPNTATVQFSDVTKGEAVQVYEIEGGNETDMNISVSRKK